MAQLVETFISDTTARLEELHRGVEGTDTELVARTCHSLKGSSANLGASTMAELCTELEVAAASHQLAGGADILRRLEDEFGRVRPALSAAFPKAAR